MRIRVLFLAESMKKKLTMVNFPTLLCDGSMDKCYRSVYVAFAGPKTGKPTPAFLEVVASFESQDTTRLKKAIINT